MSAVRLWLPTPRRVGNLEITEAEVYCDLCNVTVFLLPVPVWNEYALCLSCLERVLPDWEAEIPPSVRRVWRWIEAGEASE